MNAFETYLIGVFSLVFAFIIIGTLIPYFRLLRRIRESTRTINQNLSTQNNSETQTKSLTTVEGASKRTCGRRVRSVWGEEDGTGPSLSD